MSKRFNLRMFDTKPFTLDTNTHVEAIYEEAMRRKEPKLWLQACGIRALLLIAKELYYIKHRT